MKYSRYGVRVRRRRRSKGIRGSSAVIVRGLALVSIIGVCAAAISWVSKGTFRAYDQRTSSAVKPEILSSLALGQRAGAITARNSRIVYPYSVVPGGVSSTAELKEAATHDPVIADHYKDFDYDHGRIIQVEQPRFVYVSYRRGKHVYWTHKQVSLHKGEKLLSDGKLTARARCGNQVSVLPQANTVPEEPTEAELDRPDALASGMQEFPGNLNSSLLQVDPVVPIGPSAPGWGTGFGGPPPSVFVPLPPGNPVAGGPGGGNGGNGCPSNANQGNCNPPPPPPPPPPTVPEPGGIVLTLSGVVAVYAHYRFKRP